MTIPINNNNDWREATYLGKRSHEAMQQQSENWEDVQRTVEMMKTFPDGVSEAELRDRLNAHFTGDRQKLKDFLEENFANPEKSDFAALSFVMQEAYHRQDDESEEDYLDSLPFINAPMMVRVVLGRPGDTNLWGRHPDGRRILCEWTHGSGCLLSASSVTYTESIEEFRKYPFLIEF